MYLVTFENSEENYHGPFTMISLDSVNDKGVAFLCTDSVYGKSRWCVEGSFDIVDNDYLEV